MSCCLSIDTTAEKLYMTLSLEGRVFAFVSDTGKKGHSSTLMPAVDKLLADAGCKIGDVDTVAVVVGPGSFTGIRIGVSAATAIAYANSAKRISVNTFELLAYNRANCTAMVDAGHGNVYAAVCEGGAVKEAYFITAEDAKKTDLRGFCAETAADRAQTLARITEKKAAAGEYVTAFEPYYMRKSQAERNQDEV